MLGAPGGALVGGLIGSYMEQQRRAFEKLLAPAIAAGAIRVEKLSDDRLLVGMTGETAFEVDSDQIKPGFYSTMDKISGVVNKYGKTRLAIAGHTDSTGSAAHNQELSERRADSVEAYLLADNLVPCAPERRRLRQEPVHCKQRYGGRQTPEPACGYHHHSGDREELTTPARKGIVMGASLPTARFGGEVALSA